MVTLRVASETKSTFVKRLMIGSDGQSEIRKPKYSYLHDAHSTLMTRWQCRPVSLDQYVNHDPRLIFEARLVFKVQPLLVQLR